MAHKRITLKSLSEVFGNAYLVKRRKKKRKDTLKRTLRWNRLHAARRGIRASQP